MSRAQARQALPAKFQTALQNYQTGQLAQAETLFREILALEPRHADTLHLLAAIAYATGRQEEAADLAAKAIKSNPAVADYYNTCGLAYYNLGRFQKATAQFRKAVQVRAAYPEALNNLGNALREQGDIYGAQHAFQEAIRINPGYPEACNNLGLILAAIGKGGEARACYEKALAFRPDFALAHNNLGQVCLNSHEYDQAANHFSLAIQYGPTLHMAHCNLATTLEMMGKTAEAEKAFRQALAIKPDYAEGLHNLGALLQMQDKNDEAEQCLHEALRVNPTYVDAFITLGMVQNRKANFIEAAECFKQALHLMPDSFRAYINLGNLYKDRGKFKEAHDCCFHAHRLNPGDGATASLLGGINMGFGKMQESVKYFKIALEISPHDPYRYSNLLLTLNYASGYGAEEIYREHLGFAGRFEAPLKALRQSHDNERSLARKLRIGYLSPDFRQHSVSYFISSLLAQHDHDRFEIFCYHSNAVSDAVTERLRGWADHWRPVAAMTDDAVAEQIRTDRIDILIDLAGHTAGNRLLVFARKPAPVQASWLGYPNTTGLEAMDYRISDRYVEPEGLTERYSSETIVRLPDAFCCYTPPANGPDVAPPPVLEKGYITFGSMNNFAKTSPEAVALWAAILKAVPASRLLLESTGLGDESVREEVAARFAAHGVGPEQLHLLERKPEHQYVLYNQIDICLDPFPCNGGTTTCDALWMGVPVVTLAGETFVSRMGVTWLTNVGLAELVAHSPEHYLEIACALASDPDKLTAMRASQRQAMAASPLTDAPRFARSMENAYRAMWEKWLEATQNGPMEKRAS